MKKRILAFCLAGMMAFSLVPAEVFAASAKIGAAAGEESQMNAEEAAGPEEASVPLEADLSAIDDTPVEDTKQTENDLPAGEAQENDNQAEENGIEPFGQEASGEKVELPDRDMPEESERSSRESQKEGKQEEAESEELLELPSVEENVPEAQSMGNWTPPVGGMERPEAIEISKETAQSLGIADAEETKGAMEHHSAVLGSQKYNSPWDVYSTNYIYNRLSQNEKNFWDKLDEILQGYLNGNQNAGGVSVYNRETGRMEYYYIPEKGIAYTYFGLTDDRAADLFLMFSYSKPQYYFLGNGYLIGNGAMFPIIYDEFADGTTRAAETAKVKAQIEAMVSQIKTGKTDVEKAKIAHDLICKKVLYDHTYATNPHTLYHQSAYSVFRENYTVCAGYAKAFMILMNGAGVDTICITSLAHAWNMISLNDSWYNIDCTWDDTDGAGGMEMGYLYFNRSTAMFTRSQVLGGLDQDGYHQAEYFYNGIMPAATQDSGATWTSIGSIGTPSASAKTAMPEINKKDISGGIQVTLSTSTPGADIYYTIDGSSPSSAATRSYHYTGAFTVEQNTTVKAIAVCDTMWDSNVASATLKKSTYTVKFNTRGYGTISSQKILSGNKVKKPTSPKRSKYTFEGWYTDTKYTKKWNFSQAVTKNITLYAKWKKVSVGKASIKKLTNVSGKKIKVNVNKVSGAKGYQIRYATNSKMKSAKSAATSSASKTLTKLKKNKKYYVQVRAYKKDSKGTKVYGAWSKKKTVTVKK